jgi:Protein of unknown function (DUF3365)
MTLAWRRSRGLKLWLLGVVFGLLSGLLINGIPTIAGAPADDNRAIAESLAAMLRAGMTVIAANQGKIDDDAMGDKGLDGKSVLDETIKVYQKQTGRDPNTVDAGSRHGRLLRAEMDAIVAVMTVNQATINAKGTGFKGFIPPYFARLVNEEFGKRAAGAAEIRITAPPELIRNRRARPDAWEAEVITTKFLATDWPVGQPFMETVQDKGRPAFRMMVPGYYGQSCLSCHGTPKGQLDITGYPKEGAKLNQLGAAISILLFE